MSPATTERGWEFWIDRGGTFTDVVARRPDGEIVTRKLLSDNPGHYDDAALEGMRVLLGLDGTHELAGAPVESVKMGTTVATNALLERKGERTALVITRGFADALRIAYQNRPRLFVRRIELPEPLFEHVVEVDERMGAGGETLRPVDLHSARRGLEDAYARGFRSAAIAFVHGYRYPVHERKVADLAREIGFTQVSVSHEASPLIKLVSRGDTTVVDAYLTPILRRYIDHVAGALGDARLMFMQSNGGLTQASLFQGKDSILSGPAGGIVGGVRASQAAGFERVITFDMGGTSTDVAHFDGEYERSFDTPVAGVRMQAPMMRIHTVAAGGGSKLVFDGARYRVGPESAGADPGPACYRKGGPLTVTDANLMVGKINPAFFPCVFGPGQDEPLDGAVVAREFEDLAAEIHRATGDSRTPREVAEGFLRIAVENMANAIKRISVQRGYDVTRYTLCCFGGAGGQHACLVADALGMSQVFIHPLAGVLSAYGMGLADIRAIRERTVEGRLGSLGSADFDSLFAPLEQEAVEEVRAQGILQSRISCLRKAHVKYEGTDTALVIPYESSAALGRAFEETHRRRFGFAPPDKPLMVAAVSVEAVGAAPEQSPEQLSADSVSPEERVPEPVARVPMFTGGAEHDTPVYRRAELDAGGVIDGPAIVVEDNATTVVEPGWRAEVRAGRNLVLTRAAPRRPAQAVGTEVDPVMLEVFNNLFMSIAEQMGVTLANTAQSVNIKERLDFSCAVFDRDGHLVANAPHVPVHLGSMSESVQAILRARRGTMEPGDVFVLNAPYNGGTHLPDITVITPVFDRAGDRILFFVASRGHHADVGGISPGSMPPASRTVEEEGVLIDDFQLVSRGRFREEALVALLTSGPYPVRNPRQNVFDLQAQVAANETGVRELGKMVDQFGLEVVQAYMGHVQDNAEESVRRVLDVLRDGAFATTMDDGAEIRVKITIDRDAREAVVDFTGTSDQRPNNFNAPFAVTRAAVLYVFRTLVDDEIPLNSGCLKPLKLVAPEGSMLNPRYPAAVVAGNVETSQWVTDALFGALGVMAAAQGTMNNFTFGNARHQYYETLCGGAGAGPDFDGASAVHTHMTNSRLTDVEVLEWRFPVLVDGFAVRRGSGGAGRHRGGDGVVRRIKFLEPMSAAILSSRRKVAPFGLEGGAPGAPGRNAVERADGRIEELPGTAEVEMGAGDVFVIETPGGGGFGRPE